MFTHTAKFIFDANCFPVLCVPLAPPLSPSSGGYLHYRVCVKGVAEQHDVSPKILTVLKHHEKVFGCVFLIL